MVIFIDICWLRIIYCQLQIIRRGSGQILNYFLKLEEL